MYTVHLATIFLEINLTFRPSLPFAVKIRESTFISMVWPTIHVNLSRKRSFSKTLFKSEEFENAGFWFSCEWKTF